ncbi:MAG: hypothetical protein IPM20_06335 [Gammaproteobacteria bacterium]|nr:hypothetical protein [Gammaproteobacteria bacterium]
MPQWELLVTEGHVRAARWRSTARFIVVASISLIILGLIGIRILPDVKPAPHIADAKQQLVVARQQALAQFLASKGAPPQTLPTDSAKAFALPETQEIIDRLTQLLSNTGELPSEVIKLDPEEFWTGDWTPGKIIAVATRRDILVGFYVNKAAFTPNAQVGQQVSLGRVFSLYHRVESPQKWDFYCLAVPGSLPCGRGEPLSPSTIPETLRTLTPREARP